MQDLLANINKLQTRREIINRLTIIDTYKISIYDKLIKDNISIARIALFGQSHNNNIIIGQINADTTNQITPEYINSLASIGNEFYKLPFIGFMYLDPIGIENRISNDIEVIKTTNISFFCVIKNINNNLQGDIYLNQFIIPLTIQILRYKPYKISCNNSVLTEINNIDKSYWFRLLFGIKNNNTNTIHRTNI